MDVDLANTQLRDESFTIIILLQLRIVEFPQLGRNLSFLIFQATVCENGCIQIKYFAQVIQSKLKGLALLTGKLKYNKKFVNNNFSKITSNRL